MCRRVLLYLLDCVLYAAVVVATYFSALHFPEFVLWSRRVYYTGVWYKPSEEEMYTPLFAFCALCGYMVFTKGYARFFAVPSVLPTATTATTTTTAVPSPPPLPSVPIFRRDPVSLEIAALNRVIEEGTAERRAFEARVAEQNDAILAQLLELRESSGGGRQRLLSQDSTPGT